MTTQSLRQTSPPTEAVPSPSRRATGTVGLISLATFAAAVLVTPKQDITTAAQLHTFLEDNGWRQAVAAALMLASGLAWLLFVVGLGRLLPTGYGRDLFITAAVAGQAATWAGVALATATAPPSARAVTVSVYEAFGEAGHLAVAAGTAASGLALVGLARATVRTGLWATTLTRCTGVAGVVLVVAAVIGPVSIPVYAVWLLAVSIALLRSGTTVSEA